MTPRPVELWNAACLWASSAPHPNEQAYWLAATKKYIELLEYDRLFERIPTNKQITNNQQIIDDLKQRSGCT